mmetsp:Transcript_19683/g.66980  ORF Transcript_19683/g.66980 Transcript_19683/m.66980 type:complete len:272 (+) Transcript_19683:241-1056(+)
MRGPLQKGRTSHMRTASSIPLVRRCVPAGESLIPVTASVCPSSRISSTSAPLRRSQLLTHGSMPAVCTPVPSAASSAASTWYRSASVCTLLRTRRSHSFALQSSAPDTTSGGPFRAGETVFTTPVCSRSRLTWAPVSTSHARTVRSALPLTTLSPSGAHLAHVTAFRWPSSSAVLLQPPEARCQSMSVLSTEPLTTCAPPGEKSRARTAAPWPSSSIVGAGRRLVRRTPEGAAVPSATTSAAGPAGSMGSVRARFEPFPPSSSPAGSSTTS